MTLRSRVHDSPLGRLTLVASDAGLRALLWPDDDGRVPLPDTIAGSHRTLDATTEQLDQYFAGQRRAFDVPLDPQGTPFQRKVWEALRRIRYGETVSYTELASRIGRPTAARAVGAANGRNPISIIVPCHRVVGASGALTGFAGGLSAKRWLLDLEQVTPTEPRP